MFGIIWLKYKAGMFSKIMLGMYEDPLLFAGIGDVGWYGVFTVHDHCEGFTVVSFLEWRLSTYQHEEDHS